MQCERLGVLAPRGNDRYQRGSQVIARTNRGLEAGDVLCLANEDTADMIKDAVHGQILREMTPEDINELAHIKATERQEFETCQRHVRATESVDATGRH